MAAILSASARQARRRSDDAEVRMGLGRQAVVGVGRAVGALVGLVLAFALLAGALRLATTAGASASPASARPGEADVWTLLAGDCFNLASTGTGTAVTRAAVVPCTDPHRYEVVLADRLQGAAPPADADMQAWLRAACAPAFSADVGKAIGQTDLTVSCFDPGAAAWAGGVHSVQCSASDPNGNPMTLSVRGSGR